MTTTWRRATEDEINKWVRCGTPPGQRYRLTAGVGLEIAES